MLRNLICFLFIVLSSCNTRYKDESTKRIVTAPDTLQDSSTAMTTSVHGEAVRGRIETKAVKATYTPAVGVKSPIAILHALDDNVPVEISFDPKHDTIVSLPKGTVVKIPAYAFKSIQTGAIVEEKVHLLIREYYSISDFVMANLTTATASAMLETGGMINITAQSQAVVCEIASGKEIEIRFPAIEKKDGMELFTGKRDDDDLIVWNAEGLKTDDNDVNKSSEAGGYDVYSESQDVPEFVGGYRNFTRYISKNLKYPPEARRKGIQGTVIVQMVISKAGLVVNPVVYKGVDSRLDKAAIDVFASMPRWKPGRRNGVAVDVPMSFPIRFNLDGAGVGRASDATDLYDEEAVRDIEMRMKDSTLQKPSLVETAFYVLQTSKLGWINCDRFIDVKNKTAFKVYVGDRKNIDVKLIFYKYRSVLTGERSGDYYLFPDVPKGEKVIVFSLENSNNSLYFGMGDAIISSQSDFVINLNPATVDMVKHAVKNFKVAKN